MEKNFYKNILKAKENDLIVDEYYIDMYYIEAKLKCGLYVYCGGHESNGRNGFVFMGSIKELIIMDKPYIEISSAEDKFNFEKKCVEHFQRMENMKNPNNEYFVIEKIAKNIIKKSEATILFYELKDYTLDLKEKYKIEFQNRMKPYQDKIDAILERVKKSKQTPTLSNNIDDSQKK